MSILRSNMCQQNVVAFFLLILENSTTLDSYAGVCILNLSSTNNLCQLNTIIFEILKLKSEIIVFLE